MFSVEKRIEDSETRIFKAALSNTTNHYDTLFGGTTQHMMDEASFKCTTRISRKKAVTISTDKINFTKAIPKGTNVELVARNDKVGNTSCVVRVEIYKEDMFRYNRELAVVGKFTFVAINIKKKPVHIIDRA